MKKNEKREHREARPNVITRMMKKHNTALREEKADEIREKEDLNSVKMRKSTQMTLPIEDVFNGCIIMKDGTYSKIVELSPTNFSLKPASEQALIIAKFANLLRIAPSRIHFKSVSKKADIDKFIHTLKEEQRSEKVPKCKIVHSDQMQLIREVSEAESVSRRFFCILTLDPKEERGLTSNVYAITQRLNGEMENLVKQFHLIGNEAVSLEVDPNDPTQDQEDMAIIEILYDIICRKKSQEESCKEHVLNVMKAYCREANVGIDNPPYIPAVEYFSPGYIDLSHPDYVVVDGTYYMIGYIPSNKFPMVVPSGWLSPLVEAGEGIDVDLWLEKRNKEEISGQLNRTIRHSRVSMDTIEDTSESYEAATDAVTTGFYFKEGFKAGQDFYYMCIMITISANSLRNARYIYKEMASRVVQNDMKMFLARFHQEEAFMSTLPCGWLDNYFFQKGRQNMLTMDAASSYMLTSYSMCDTNGIFLGVNDINHSATLVDIFNSDLYRNANMAILGSSGSGKTFTTQCMSERLRLKQYQVFCIIPKKGVEFKPCCDAVGGQYIIVSGGSYHCINILEIRKPQDENMRLLYGNDIEQSLLSQKIGSVKTFFSLLVPDISLEEKQSLDTALISTYAKKGITKNNDSLLDPNNPGKYKEMPILEDLQNVLKEMPNMERIEQIMEPLVHGSESAFNGQTNVDLDNLYIVFDLDFLSKELLPAGMYIVMDYVWDKVREDKTMRKAIFMDEIWALIGAGASSVAADFVLNIFKLIRGYGGAAICSTQDLNDFFSYQDGAYGRGIINACKFKIVMGLEEEEAKRVQETLELDQAEINMVKQFSKGKGLVCVNHSNVAVDFKASDSECELFSTDPKILAAIAKKRKRQRNMIV